MLKILFQQMIEQYGGPKAWTIIKLPHSDSPFIKLIFKVHRSKYLMIVELNCFDVTITNIYEYIAKDIVNILSLKFY